MRYGPTFTGVVAAALLMLGTAGCGSADEPKAAPLLAASQEPTAPSKAVESPSPPSAPTVDPAKAAAAKKAADKAAAEAKAKAEAAAAAKKKAAAAVAAKQAADAAAKRAAARKAAAKKAAEEAAANVYYENCDAVRAAGAAPIRRGEPGYDDHLDRDGDGIACET